MPKSQAALAHGDETRFFSLFRKKAAKRGGCLSYRDFIDLALYHPEVGYYQQPRSRVGYGEGSDFYTARSLGTVFSRLVIEAAATLLGAHECARCTFVEIGVEPDQSLLKEDGASPFATGISLGVRDTLKLPERAIVFANELFDAQPFHRLRFGERGWEEWGVYLSEDPLRLEEIPLPAPTEAIAAVIKELKELPTALPQGYQLDLPLWAEHLLGQIAALPWQGLFYTIDYGTSWDELLTVYPQGTARTYHRHRIGKDLLKHPGKRDITCHLCWDRLKAILKKHDFLPLGCERQERFFMNHARSTIRSLMSAAPRQWSPERSTLQQLLHPAHMGLKFQVLWGIRRSQRC